MTTLANLDGKTMATEADMMREYGNESFIAFFALDAKDALHIIKEMTPAQRMAALPDLMSASNSITFAIKEAMKE